jgi:hypothetical protein
MFCPVCDLASRRRRYGELCPDGTEARQLRDGLRAAADHEARLDKMPDPNQEALFGPEDLP